MDLHGTFPVLLKLSKGTEKISDMKVASELVTGQFH